jgi:hypothetical protein
VKQPKAVPYHPLLLYHPLPTILALKKQTFVKKDEEEDNKQR